jgi:hypothetical protein
MFTVLETESTENRREGRKGGKESMKKGGPILSSFPFYSHRISHLGE